MIFGFSEPEVPTVEPEEVKRAMDAGEQYVLLDVRTTGEYSRGKLAGSINVPVEEISREAQKYIPDLKQKTYVYCLSGARSSVAVEAMIQLGYTQVFNMSHGLLAWRAKYFPVEN